MHRSPRRVSDPPYVFVIRTMFASRTSRSGSVHADGRRRRTAALRPHHAHAVPGILFARFLAFAFVTLEEARHEELLRQRRQLYTPRLAVVDDLVLIVEVD